MFYDPRHEGHGLPRNPWLALIVSRPIGWASTNAPDCSPNLAPYSSFGTLSFKPPFLMFFSGGDKDSVNNAQTTGFFCVNIVTFELCEAMNLSSAPFPPQTDEFGKAGLTAEPCHDIPCPRVAESSIAKNYRLFQIVTLTSSTGEPCLNKAAIGEVVGIHIDDAAAQAGSERIGSFPIHRH